MPISIPDDRAVSGVGLKPTLEFGLLMIGGLDGSWIPGGRRRWPGGSPGHYVRFHRSIKSGTLGLTETPKNQDTAQSFQRTLQVGHCLIASGPAALSVGFCTVYYRNP